MRPFVLVCGLLILSAGLAALVPAASASSAAEPCVTVYRLDERSMVACANLRDPECPVIVHHHNGWLTQTYCLPPQPNASVQEVNCVTVYDFPDAGYKLCPTLDDPNCLLWEEVTTFTGTERRCLVPRP